MTNSSDDLRRLVEAVRNAGADIAPTYREYVQLAFAIATDCGEAGRSDFHALCSLSSKYDTRHADKLFTNALRTGHHDVHLGTAFHLADLCGMRLAPPPPISAPASGNRKSQVPLTTSGEAESPGEEGAGEETFRHDSEPYAPLPVFPQDYEWPSFLARILSYGDNPWQRDVLLLGSLTVLGRPCRTRCAASTAASGRPRACKPSSPPRPPRASGSCRGCACWRNPCTMPSVLPWPTR